MMPRTLRRVSALCGMAIALAAAGSTVVGQTRDNPTLFTGPAAIAHIWTYDGGQTNWFTDIDVSILGELASLFRVAGENAGGAGASAEVSTDAFAAQSSTAGDTSATAHAYKVAIARDPQHRLQVTARLKLKAAAGLDESPGRTATARWSITVCIPEGPGTLFYDDLGHLNWNGIQCAGGVGTLPYGIEGIVVGGTDLPPGGRVIKRTYRWGVPTEQESTGHKVTATIDEPVSVIPGLPYMIRVIASSGGNAVSAVDPTFEADPSNPDVTFEFPNVGDNPNPQPLLRESPDALRARGIDPQPFLDLGFFDSPSGPPSEPPPPSDTQAPSTLATPSDASTWTKSPVTMTFAATDNVGGSGVKEIHVSLTGASTGSYVIPGNSGSVQVTAEGRTFVSYFAVDNAGNQEPTGTMRLQIDRTPPVLSGLPAGCVIWPPDHRLVPVGLIKATDSLSGVAGPLSIAVTSNEPESGLGDGDLAPDVVITGGDLKVRAERSGKGAGRVYAITATAADVAGNIATATATCTVPHDYTEMILR